MNPSDEGAARRAIVAASREMQRLGLNGGTSGNVSLRWGDGLLVTPSGIPPERTEADDVVLLRPDGTSDDRLVPSSEWRFHRDILAARPEVGAVVHAHPTYATAFAMCRREIPAAHYMIAAAGGPTVRCSGYATFGTPELSALALEALRDRTCCLLANHGVIATGPTLDKALWVAVELETLCRQYAVALQVGAPSSCPTTRSPAPWRSSGATVRVRRSEAGHLERRHAEESCGAACLEARTRVVRPSRCPLRGLLRMTPLGVRGQALSMTLWETA